MLDTKALAEATATIVRDHVEKATAPLVERIALLEARAPVAGPPGADGRDGENGKDGTDGIAGENGKDGADGRDGVDGTPGEPGADGNDGAPGADGVHGDKGTDGVDGKDGADGINGKDGVGVAGALIDRAGQLVVTLTDGTTRELGPVIGKNGADGADGAKGADGRDGEAGADGFGFDDLAFEHDGERGFKLLFVKGDRSKEFAFEVPVVLDRGVWKEREEPYKKGDAVSWAGSLWIAQKETTAKPDAGDGWRLSVKRGRDGKDAGK